MPPALDAWIGSSAQADALAAISWDFKSRTAAGELEAIHPYPAKFIPDIPSSFLDALGVIPGAAVLDPFAGCGTTLVEGQRRGIPSIGIDLNPIACLITRVKTSPLPASADKVLREVLDCARKDKVCVPTIPNLDHWFMPKVQAAVARLQGAIERAPPTHQDILNLALSSILVRVSNQDSDTRYAAVEKGIDPAAIATFFQTSATRIIRALSARRYQLASAQIIEGDTLAVKPDALKIPVGAIITSPPYPNAYEYWLYHKYRMYWLGFDPQAVKEREIGARAHFFKTKRHTADYFVDQMRQTFALIDKVLVPGGYAAFVVGRSRIHGVVVDNAAIIANAGREFDFKPMFKTERVIAATRKSFNLSHANIKTETVLVLSR